MRKRIREHDPKVAYPFIIEREGLKTKAYRCTAGKWTIGVGHTDATITRDTVITTHEALELLDKDIKKFYLEMIRLITVPVTQNQFIALLSFTFNLGSANLSTSKLLKYLNAGNYKACADQFLEWNKVSTGKIDPKTGKTIKREDKGLTNRRNIERNLFLTPDEDSK